MTRIKAGVMTKKRHKKVLKQTKGYWGQRKNVFRRAKQTLLRAMSYATTGRKLKKRDMRSLFIARIKAAAHEHNVSYSVLMHSLKQANILIDRKMLSQVAIADPAVFTAILQAATAQGA